MKSPFATLLTHGEGDSLLLRHRTTGETAPVAVEGSTAAWKLFVRWRPREMPAGVYVLDLKENRLRASERGARLEWLCADHSAAVAVWKRLQFPGREGTP